MARVTKQQQINELQQKLHEKDLELSSANSRKADLAEAKHKAEECVKDLRERYNKLYEEGLIGALATREFRTAAEFYHGEAVRLTREITFRGNVREKHDLEYAVVRAILRSNNKLTPENLRRMQERTPGCDLKKLIMVASEFDSEENASGEKKEVKTMEVKVYWSDADGWKKQ